MSDHDELRDLVAAYALDATEDDEAERIERHVRECPRCRADLREFREVAARLAHTGEDAPTGIWERVATDGTAPPPAAPAMRMVVGGKQAGRRSVVRRIAMPLTAAAAAAAVTGLSIGLVHDSHRIDQLSSAMAQARGADRAFALAIDPSARRETLTSPTGGTAAVLAVGANRQAIIVPVGLPPLPDSRTYQVWTISGRTARSAGLLSSDSPGLVFSVPSDAGTVAVTVEPRGGSSGPTSNPVASAPI